MEQKKEIKALNEYFEENDITDNIAYILEIK